MNYTNGRAGSNEIFRTMHVRESKNQRSTMRARCDYFSVVARDFCQTGWKYNPDTLMHYMYIYIYISMNYDAMMARASVHTNSWARKNRKVFELPRAERSGGHIFGAAKGEKYLLYIYISKCSAVRTIHQLCALCYGVCMRCAMWTM